MKRSYLVWMTVAALAMVGCGSGDKTYSDKCAAACKVPSTGPCASQSEADCQSTCTAMTSGLAVECVQCIVEHSGWSGRKCSCYGTGCDLVYFGPGPIQTSPPIARTDGGPATECAAEQEKCSSFDLQEASGSNCAKFCGGRTDGPSSSKPGTGGARPDAG
jgi:hypothetical protein